MSYKTVSPGKVASIVLCFIWATFICASPNCKLQWGPSSAVKGKPCSFTKVAIAAPTSIYVNNFKWNTDSQLFSLELSFKNIELLSGLKLSFYHRGEMKAHYTLPLYSDPEYNILKENTLTTLSIPKSDLVWKMPNFKKEATFDGFTIYLGTKTQASKKLTLEITKTNTAPRSPQGKISITFDDGYESNYQAALMMKPLKLTGTAYIIPDAIGKPGHLTQGQMMAMKKMGWSLSTHLTTPVTQIPNLKEVIKKTKAIVRKWGTAESASHFALPLGKYNQKSLAILSKEFKSIRLAGGFTEVLPVQDYTRLKTINVTNKMSPKEVLKKCTEAVLNKEWAILMFHYIDQPDKGELNYSSKNFLKLMKLLRPYQAHIETVEQVLKE